MSPKVFSGRATQQALREDERQTPAAELLVAKTVVIETLGRLTMEDPNAEEMRHPISINEVDLGMGNNSKYR